MVPWVHLAPIAGPHYTLLMWILSKRSLREFWECSEYSDAEGSLRAWYHEFSTGHWPTPNAIKTVYRSASILKSSRVVFNICGNKYRLIVTIDYARHKAWIKFIGTHRQYDQIDAETV